MTSTSGSRFYFVFTNGSGYYFSFGSFFADKIQTEPKS